jgi:hypothetical protein
MKVVHVVEQPRVVDSLRPFSLDHHHLALELFLAIAGMSYIIHMQRLFNNGTLLGTVSIA